MSIPFKKKKRNRGDSKIGEPPGTLIYTGNKHQEEFKLRVIDYSEEDYSIKEIKKVPNDINEI